MTAVDALHRGPTGPHTTDLALDADVPDAAPLDGPEPHQDRPGREPLAARLTRPVVILPVVVALLAGALVVALAEWGGSSGPGVGEAIVTVHGSAFVDRADGTSGTVTDSVRLHPGDGIVVRLGSADFELADGIHYEALGRTAGGVATSVQMARTPTLRAGRLLVIAPQGAALHVGLADVRLRSGAVARIARSYAVTVGSYRRTTVLASAGVARAVPALRSAVAAATGEVGRLRPIAFTGDRWDRHYLADAVAVDRELAPLARGMRAARTKPAALLAAVRGELRHRPSAATVRRLEAHRPVRLDLGIGLAVIGSGTRGTFHHRWTRGAAFHDAGASWGLVAMDVGATPDSIGSVLRSALDGRVLAAGVDRSGTSGTAGRGPGSGSASGTGGGTAGAGSNGAAGTGGATGTGSGTGVGGTGITVPGGGSVPVTVPGVSVPNVSVPGVSVPITTPAIPAVPIIPGVTTPAIPIVPVVTGIVTTVTGIVTGLLPGRATTTTTRPHTTTTTTPLGGLLGHLGL